MVFAFTRFVFIFSPWIRENMVRIYTYTYVDAKHDIYSKISFNF